MGNCLIAASLDYVDGSVIERTSGGWVSQGGRGLCKCAPVLTIILILPITDVDGSLVVRKTRKKPVFCLYRLCGLVGGCLPSTNILSLGTCFLRLGSREVRPNSAGGWVLGGGGVVV